MSSSSFVAMILWIVCLVCFVAFVHVASQDNDGRDRAIIDRRMRLTVATLLASFLATVMSLPNFGVTLPQAALALLVVTVLQYILVIWTMNGAIMCKTPGDSRPLCSMHQGLMYTFPVGIGIGSGIGTFVAFLVGRSLGLPWWASGILAAFVGQLLYFGILYGLLSLTMRPTKIDDRRSTQR